MRYTINRPVLTIDHVSFGKGMPKICLPIIESTHQDIIKTLTHYETLDHWQIVELRLDFYEQLMQKDALIALLKEARQVTRHLILATIRTETEGGQIVLSQEDYRDCVKAIIDSQAVDLIDLELSQGEILLRELIDYAKVHGVYTLISSHDFNETPCSTELVCRLTQMEALGGDLLKLACMPLDEEDVVRLQNVTFECANSLHQPLITMAMGQLGVLTRVTGEVYGSTMTFATAGQASAPGQIPLEDMYQVLEVIHDD